MTSEKESGKSTRNDAKLARKAKREAIAAEAKALFSNKIVENIDTDSFGFIPLNFFSSNADSVTSRVWTSFDELYDQRYVGEKVWIRARIQDSRGKGSVLFLTMRQKLDTMQAVLQSGKGITKDMIKWVSSLPWESIIDVYGLVTAPENKFEDVTLNVELQVEKLFCSSKSSSELPFQFRDANRPQTICNDDKREDTLTNEEKQIIQVNQDVRLDNRILDLRLPINQSIFRMQSSICCFFREFLLKEKFVEIHTPKLISGMSEGGSNVFTLSYFGNDACLAQSPQLYKQMVICGDMDRVFEIGPVFRAENSNTYRHLCEFTGMDLEMTFKESINEVIDMVDRMLKYIFEKLNENCGREMNEINRIYPFASPFKWSSKTPIINFKEAIELLRENNVENIPDEIKEFDLSSEHEKILGKIMKQKFDVDYYIIIHYPSKVRPFYTMPLASDEAFSNSYDFFMRGEEILSGSQRINDPKLLSERATENGIKASTIQQYIDSFKLGAPPHGGCGIGLERVLMLFLGLRNIRQTSIFPRDPKRLTP